MKNYTGTKVILNVEQFSFNSDRFEVRGTEGIIRGQYSETSKIRSEGGAIVEMPRMFAVSFGGKAALQIPSEYLTIKE